MIVSAASMKNLFLMEEFATLGHMDIMERAAAYFPGFGVKLWAVLQDTTQLRCYYQNSWETFLGNAGVVQCFANADQTTLAYLSQRLEGLLHPFELRTAFARNSQAQLLLFEGGPALGGPAPRPRGRRTDSAGGAPPRPAPASAGAGLSPELLTHPIHEGVGAAAFLS
ncbi:type IV secretory system conjugative DNA transfer family protein [uncultured Methylobacterium sp.]|uniref:type IV secretory system conjugative DNA transfer family protein n=1 Tax=uncultured Methylobacterium sp. TaxID=157278 RepID=UPI0035CC3053